MKCTLPVFVPLRFDQPLEMIARTPAVFTASIMVAVNSTWSSSTMLPNPIYIGGGPDERKAWRSNGGSNCGGSRKKKPQTSRDSVSYLG